MLVNRSIGWVISWPIDWKIWVSSVDRSLYWSGGQSVERLVGRSAKRLVRAIGLWNDGAVDLMVDGSSNQSVDRLVERSIVQGQLGSWPVGIAVGRSKLQAAQCNRCKRPRHSSNICNTFWHTRLLIKSSIFTTPLII